MDQDCQDGSYSVSSWGKFGIFVKSKNPTMEDCPGLSPVLPVQQKHQIWKTIISEFKQIPIHRSVKLRQNQNWSLWFSPHLSAMINQFGLINNSCLFQQMALKRQRERSEFSCFCRSALKCDSLVNMGVESESLPESTWVYLRAFIHLSPFIQQSAPFWYHFPTDSGT